MRVGSGVPGNAAVRQSAKAQSEAGTGMTPLFTPAGVSAVAEINFALAVSRVAGVRLVAPGSDWVLPFRFAKRSHTWPVMFFATGTSMPSRSEPSVDSG